MLGVVREKMIILTQELFVSLFIFFVLFTKGNRSEITEQSKLRR